MQSKSGVSRICVPSSSIASTSSILKRHSHIGSAPLYVPPSTKLTIQSFPPMVNPSKRQPPQYINGTVKSIKVEGPLGTVVIPLRDFVQLNWEEANKLTETGEKAQSVEEVEPRKLTLSIQDDNIKIQKGTWGLTRALLANAIEGVQEGHSISIRMVGVGYRAAVENDPFYKPDKFEAAFTSIDDLAPFSDSKRGNTSQSLGFFVSEEQKKFYQNFIKSSNESQTTTKQRLSLRLGYSHPIFMQIPRGITCTTPQPTKIVLKGADKEALGLFAANIRKWRPPEPYKGKGVFVGDETIKLKAARKK